MTIHSSSIPHFFGPPCFPGPLQYSRGPSIFYRASGPRAVASDLCLVMTAARYIINLVLSIVGHIINVQTKRSRKESVQLGPGTLADAM